MGSERSLFTRLMIVGISAVAISYADLSSRTAAAAYDYIPPQIAPPVASNLSTAQIVDILNENTTGLPPYLVAYQLMTTDAHGAVASAAPLKVVPTDDPDHPYLGIFHNQINSTQFATYLGYSPDLKIWHTIGEIHRPASQPDLRILPDDSVLYAEEYNPGRPQVKLNYYGNVGAMTGLKALILNPGTAPTQTATLPPTSLGTNQGTPEFGHISYSGSITGSKIELNHHYYNWSKRDVQAVGTLTDFQTWSDPADTATDNLVTNARGTGKIGDREVFQVGSHIYEIIEAQLGPPGDDYGAWRLFLVDRTTSAIQQLSPKLAGGALSLGNPTISFVTLPPPSGAPALVFTCFVFGANNGTTPPGGHIFVYPLN
jgi:hypothetical protein